MTDKPRSAHNPKQAEIETSQKKVARASFKGSLSVLLLGAAVGVPVGIAVFLAYGDTVTIAAVVTFLLLLAVFSWAETPFRFPTQVFVDERGITLRFRFGHPKSMTWDEMELFRTGVLGPGRFYKVADYSAWFYRKGRKMPAIRANIGEVAYRELVRMAGLKGIRTVMYPPAKD